MSTNRDSFYLIHIRECLARVTEYTSGGREEFMEDTKTQDAVLRHLQIMGESTQRLTDALKSVNAQVKRRDLAAFRNILVHDYLITIWGWTGRRYDRSSRMTFRRLSSRSPP